MKSYLFKDTLNLFLTILFKVTSGIMFVLLALILQEFINTTLNGDILAFRRIVLFSCIYFLIMSAFNYLAGLFQARYLKNTIIQLKGDIFHGIMKKDYQKFYEENTGEYISALSNDVSLIEERYFLAIIELITDLVKFITTVVILATINIVVTLSLILAGTIMLFLPYIFSKRVEDRNNKVSSNSAYFIKKIKDIFSGYEVISSYGMENNIYTEFNKDNNQLEQARFNQEQLSAIINSISTYFFIISQLSGTAVGAYFVLIGQMSVGALMAVGQLANGIFVPIRTIIAHYTSVKGMKGINKKIFCYINEDSHRKNLQNLNDFTEKITLNNVSFSYNNENMVIDKINFSFEKNKKYAIIGESGCGKSTLVKLIFGFYHEYEGNIKIDNLEMKKIDKLSISKFISPIHQNVYMFDKTLKENICLSEEFSEEEFADCLELSGINKFIRTLKNGINTNIGENGSNISGGQKQRIAIARALIRHTPIVILDEGTSDLDAQTAYEIEHSLVEIDDLTVISVTHKLNEDILKKFDQIIFMNKGKIIESGTFDDLMKNKKEFYQFFDIEAY